jgi:hypothetical protein
MKLAVRKSRGDAVAAVTLFLKSRTRYGAAVLNQPRKIFPVATSSAANSVVVPCRF